jgi:hypothetical protein
MKEEKMININETVRQEMPSYSSGEFPEREISPELKAYLNPIHPPESLAVWEDALAWAKSFDNFSICTIEVTEDMLNKQQPTKDWGIKPLKN